LIHGKTGSKTPNLNAALLCFDQATRANLLDWGKSTILL
jgi:hypothetical protein